MRSSRKADGHSAGFSPQTSVRCAIYTRKSTDEGLDTDFNTLDAQRESAEAFIVSQRNEGWMTLPQKYDDGGYSGANMERPALKQLLDDVKAGTANCVVVYKVDRLSRSLLDFARIMEILDKHGATFVSVTQQFNTTSSMGRLTLNVLLSFAQFEREMISERTRDKMSAARRKGKWVGGSPVLGYDVAPVGGSLLINRIEAERVRNIFGLYLQLGSLIPVVEELDRRGWRMKSWTTRGGRQAGGKPIAKNNLYNLLTNMIYTGKVEFGGQVYEGEHERIVDDHTWNKVQLVLSRNGRLGGRNIGNKHGALLKGLVRCASCGVGMIHSFVSKKNNIYRYYVCIKAHQRGWAQCETRSVSAPALENAVIEQLRRVGRNRELLREVIRQLDDQRTGEKAGIREQKAGVGKALRQAARDTRGAVAVSGALGTARLVELQDHTSQLSQQFADLNQQLAAAEADRLNIPDVESALNSFDPLWEQLSTWEQERFIRTLVEQIEYEGKTGTVTLSFRSQRMRDFCNWAPVAIEDRENAKQHS
jgi:site-specific DNA recombinase